MAPRSSPSAVPPLLGDALSTSVGAALVLLAGPVREPGSGVSDARRASLDPESRRVLEALDKTGGNRNRAAKILGLSRVTLWRRLRDLGMEPSSGKER